MHLPDPHRSRIVLIGASEYADRELPDLYAVKATVRDLEATLTDPLYGLVPPDGRHCVTLLDEGDLREVGRRLSTAAEEAADLLLVYYTGHGMVAGRRRELYLGLPDSDWKRPYFNSLDYEKLRSTVLDSNAATKIIVLDCCFSGSGLGTTMASPAAEVADLLAVKGTYVLTSAMENEASLILPDERHTSFSGRLLEILQTGIPNGSQLLSIDDIYRRLVVRMQSDGLSHPQKRDTNLAGTLPILRNRAASTVRTAPGQPRTMSEPCRVTLRAAALLGTKFSVTNLATVLGQRVPALIPAIDEAAGLGFLTERGDSLRFRNEATWASVYDEMPSALRTAWHRDASLALASADAPVECVARQLLHATAGEAPPDKWMLDWLHGSADALIGRAPDVAIDLLTPRPTGLPRTRSWWPRPRTTTGPPAGR